MYENLRLTTAALCCFALLVSCGPQNIDNPEEQQEITEKNPLLTNRPCDISADTIDFGEQEIGQYGDPISIMIRNGTYAPTEVYASYYSSIFHHQFFGDFQYYAHCPALDSLEMQFFFWPKEEKEYTYEYILHANQGTKSIDKAIILKGRGVRGVSAKKPHWNLLGGTYSTSTGHDFGDTPVGSSKKDSLTLQNYGPGILHIQQIKTYKGSKSISFSKTSLDIPEGNKTTSIEIIFSPTEKGEVSDWILIYSNTANAMNPTPLKVTGKGI